MGSTLPRHCGSLPPGLAPPYHLNTSFFGRSFFDAWTFGEFDYTGGASQYLNRSSAFKNKVVEAYDTHAVLRVGGRGDTPFTRKTVRLTTNSSWMYGLFSMHFSHTPFGCGTWPAFWTSAKSGHWPDGGELDMLEYANYDINALSFHRKVRLSRRLQARRRHRAEVQLRQVPARDGPSWNRPRLRDRF